VGRGGLITRRWRPDSRGGSPRGPRFRGGRSMSSTSTQGCVIHAGSLTADLSPPARLHVVSRLRPRRMVGTNRPWACRGHGLQPVGRWHLRNAMLACRRIGRSRFGLHDDGQGRNYHLCQAATFTISRLGTIGRTECRIEAKAPFPPHQAAVDCAIRERSRGARWSIGTTRRWKGSKVWRLLYRRARPA